MRYFQYNKTIRFWVQISKATYDFEIQHAIDNKLDVSLVALGKEPVEKQDFNHLPLVLLFVAATAFSLFGGVKSFRPSMARSYSKVCC